MTLAAKNVAPQSFGNYEMLKDTTGSQRAVPESPFISMHASDYDYPSQFTSSVYSVDETQKPLTTRESVELFQDSVESARQGIQKSLAGSGNAAETLRPKLTVDLNRRNLSQIPSEVVSIIRQDVERLQLAHNQLRSIAPDFSTCLALKYLNLRDNKFQEVPQAIFGLPQLEILDLSRNQLRQIPDEIDNLRALRVFSIHHNYIESLPLCLGNISTLRVLKLTENPFNPELKGAIKGMGHFSSGSNPLPNDENERERLVTIRVRDYLRQRSSSNESHGDGPLETPRALSRFPVHPNDSGYLTSGSESGQIPRSPGFIKPTRSHHRGASSQYNIGQSNGQRRAGLTPLTLNSDKARSNADVTSQPIQSSRNKRMGMLPKKHTELDMLDENRAHRNSYHLRGQSHSSALRNVARPGESSDADATSPTSVEKGTFIRRLSSVPEQRHQPPSQDRMLETGKAILYSLHMVQPYLTSLVALVKDNNSKRMSLEKYKYQASVQLGHLDQSLVEFEATMHRSERVQRSARKTVCKAAHASMILHNTVATLLSKNIRQLVLDGEPKYIRTLMFMLYGSFNEMRNARKLFVCKTSDNQSSIIMPTPISRSSSISQPARDDMITPTAGQSRPSRRWRKDSISQRAATVNIDAVLGSQKSATSYSTVSSRTNSRSNSRVGQYGTSTATSVVSTPRSGESFGSNLLSPRSRSGSAAIHPERVRQAQIEQDQFEKIYVLLNRAADQGLQVIPYLEPRFSESYDKAKLQYAPADIRHLWSTIVKRSRLCGERSEKLKESLQEIRVNDPGARNAPEFWRLAMMFVDAYSNLLASLREARALNQIDPDLRHRLRPVYRSTVDAGTLIKNSPWNRFTTESQPSSQVNSRSPTPVQNVYSVPQPIQTQMPPPPLPTPTTANHIGYQHAHRRQNGSNGSANGSTTSPYSTGVPPTPLSAALGPAAQATIPSTPASAGVSMAGVFEGNVFQRADNLLLQGQTMVFRRPAGAP